MSAKHETLTLVDGDREPNDGEVVLAEIADGIAIVTLNRRGS